VTLAVLVFVGALAVNATERVDRTKVALVGALLVVLTQTIDQEHAIGLSLWLVGLEYALPC
jgi:Na+/H+ antiporter NhaD/arsenite permease-like protein